MFKVIYTDYETAVTYACKYVREDGRCSHYGQQVDILSRRKEELTPQVYNKLHQIISHTLCVDIHDFVTPVYQGKSDFIELEMFSESADLRQAVCSTITFCCSESEYSG